jgi:carbon storage regulator
MKDESIVINDDITIVISEIRNDRVKLGFIAPKDIAIDRLEVRQAKIRAKLNTTDIESTEPCEKPV